MSECLEFRDVLGPIGAAPGWTGDARSCVEYAADFWFGWEVTTASVGVVVGINGLNASPHYGEIEHGFRFERGKYVIIEAGVDIGVPTAFITGDRFYITRYGTEIIYGVRPAATLEATVFSDPRWPGLSLPAPVLYVSLQPSASVAFLDTSFYAANDQIENEASGENAWYPGGEDAPEGGDPARAFVAQIGGFLTLVGQAADSSLDNSASMAGELSLEGVATTPDVVRIAGEIPLTGFASAPALTSIVSGELPLTGFADANGLASLLSGASGFILLDGEATTQYSNTLIAGELNLDGLSFHTEQARPIGALVDGEIALPGLATMSNIVEGPFEVGSLGSLPLIGQATMSVGGTLLTGAGVLGELPITGFMVGVGDTDVMPTAGGYGELPLIGTTETTAFDPDANTFQISLSLQPAITGGGGDVEVEVSEDILAVTDVLTAYALEISDPLRISDLVRTFYTVAAEVSSTAFASSEMRATLVVQLIEAFDAADTVTLVQVVELADALVAAGEVQTFYQAAVSILSAMVVADTTIHAAATTVADAAGATDTLTEVIQLLALLTDAIGVTDTLRNVLTITVLETAEVTVGDTVELTAQYFANLINRVEVLAFIKTPAELAQGWVVNTEGDMPVSEYDNYTFNSLAYSPDEMLGCTDQGLYTLDGEDDAGADIAASIASLMLDFDTSKLKRMSTAYVGYTSNGQLLLKIRSVDQGLFVEHWYEGRNPAAQTPPGQNRMKLGKGLRSRYWSFELVNIDGSDFELDKVELYPIVLQRRI